MTGKDACNEYERLFKNGYEVCGYSKSGDLTDVCLFECGGKRTTVKRDFRKTWTESFEISDQNKLDMPEVTKGFQMSVGSPRDRSTFSLYATEDGVDLTVDQGSESRSGIFTLEQAELIRDALTKIIELGKDNASRNRTS